MIDRVKNSILEYGILSVIPYFRGALSMYNCFILYSWTTTKSGFLAVSFISSALVGLSVAASIVGE